MQVQVAPLRRTGSLHDSFTYELGDLPTPTPGQLVTVPFGQKLLTGIYLGPAERPRSQPVKKVKSLGAPVVSAWQLALCQMIARTHGASTSDILSTVVPELPKSFNPPLLATESDTLQDEADAYLWYRSRSAVVPWISAWLNQEPEYLAMVITSTLEDAEQLGLELKLPVVTSKLTPAKYRKLYFQVASGEVRQVVGTGRALTLPFPHRPRICLDQEEHPGHKQVSQHPRIDVARTVRNLGAAAYTFPAPTIDLFQQLPLKGPESFGNRKLLHLNQPKNDFWLTPDLMRLLDESKHQPIALIAPHARFASAFVCGTCQFQVHCQYCGHPIQLDQPGKSSVRCARCQRSVRLNERCPRCSATTWKSYGIGQARLLQLIHQRWPNHELSTSWPPLPNADVWIGTYQTASIFLKSPRRWRATIIIHGDAIRAWPDYSAEERAWQFLARLQAQAPAVPLFIQTFSPNDPFWQAWQHGADRDWYRREMQARQDLHLPPFSDQWLLYWPRKRGPAPTDPVVQLEKWTEVRVERLPDLTSGRYDRWLLQTTTPGQLERLIPWKQLWPSPWQLDMHPRSWAV